MTKKEKIKKIKLKIRELEKELVEVSNLPDDYQSVLYEFTIMHGDGDLYQREEYETDDKFEIELIDYLNSCDWDDGFKYDYEKIKSIMLKYVEETKDCENIDDKDCVSDFISDCMILFGFYKGDCTCDGMRWAKVKRVSKS